MFAETNGAREQAGQPQPVIAAAGGLLLIYALWSRSWQSAVAGPLGGALLYFGASGRNPLITMRTGGALHDEGVTLHSAVTIALEPQEVYDFWRRLENLPHFMAHLDSVEELGDGLSRWQARTPGGIPISWEARLTRDEPGRELAWETLPGANVRHRGRVTFAPATVGGGTALHVEMAYAPPGGALTAAVAELLNGLTAQQVKEELRRCKQLLETGEIATVEGQPSGRESA